MLELRDVSRRVDGVAHLSGVCLRLEGGSLNVLLGPTLAGKQIHVRDDQGQTLVLERGPQYKELAKNVLKA